MARLTWEQVAAPDFRGAIEGIKVAGDMIGRGFGAARESIGDFDATQTQAASNQIMLEALKLQDPEAAKAALATGALTQGIDPRRVNTAAMNAIAGRANALMEQEAGMLKLGVQRQGNKDFEFVNSEANRPIVNAYRDARARNDRQALAVLQEANPDFFAQVNPDVLNNLDTSGQGIFGTDQSQMITGGNWANSEEARLVDQDSKTVYQNALLAAGGIENIEGYLNANPQMFDAYGERGVQIRNAVLARVQNGGAAGATAAMAGALGGDPGASSYTGGPVDTTSFGGRNTPENATAIIQGAKELGINAEDLATIISYETGGKFDPGIRGGKNNNHIGLIQFGADEQRAHGASQNQTIAQQMPAVIDYLRKRGARPGDDITTLYKIINGGNRNANINASDGNGTIGGHVQQMMAQHRGKAATFLGLAKGNGGPARPAPIADPKLATYATATAIKLSISENEVVPLAQELEESWATKATADEVARKMTGKGGAFEGETSDYFLTELSKAQQKYKINNPEVMGKILARAKDGRQSQFFDYFEWSPGADGLKSSINYDKVKGLAEFARNRPAMVQLARNTFEQSRDMQAMAQGNAQADAARQAYTREITIAQAAGRPTDFIEQKYNGPNGILTRAMGTQSGAIRNSAPSARAGEEAPRQPKQVAAALDRALKRTGPPTNADKLAMEKARRLIEQQARSSRRVFNAS